MTTLTFAFGLEGIHERREGHRECVKGAIVFIARHPHVHIREHVYRRAVNPQLERIDRHVAAVDPGDLLEIRDYDFMEVKPADVGLRREILQR